MIDGGSVIGWIHLSEARTLESDPRAEITGLVVDSDHRSAGVGRLLVERGEEWARQRGLAVIGVRLQCRPVSAPTIFMSGWATTHKRRRKCFVRCSAAGQERNDAARAISAGRRRRGVEVCGPRRESSLNLYRRAI